MHKYFGIRIIRADQTGRAFRWSAHLHKKAGVLRAGEAGEPSRAEGVGRVCLLMPFFAFVRLCFDAVALWSGEGMEKKSPCQRGAEGLLWRLAFGRAVLTLWQGEASIFLNGQADVDGAARA